jgi:hypothetical protein
MTLETRPGFGASSGLPGKITHSMSIFNRFGHAFYSFWAKLWGDDADKILHVIEANSPLVKAAKPVVADLQQLVPDTKVSIEVARVEVHKLLSHHFSVPEAEGWIEKNFGLSVPQLLAAAARHILHALPEAHGRAGSAINLAVELALQLIRA